MIDSDDFGIPEDELIVLRSDYKICWCANLGLSVNTTPITYYPENQEKSTVVSNWQIKKAIARIEGLSSVRWSFNCPDKQCKCGVFESKHKQIKGNFLCMAQEEKRRKEMSIRIDRLIEDELVYTIYLPSFKSKLL